mmetsp:Transcript_4826/g.14418  ORF Transcript_4826/g.14418 Transcript_4826/m.14418 type:complete len:226 (+) Transcript_4826:729-1406(+)
MPPPFGLGAGEEGCPEAEGEAVDSDSDLVSEVQGRGGGASGRGEWERGFGGKWRPCGCSPSSSAVLQGRHLASPSEHLPLHTVLQQLLYPGLPGVWVRQRKHSDRVEDTEVQSDQPSEDNLHVRSSPLATSAVGSVIIPRGHNSSKQEERALEMHFNLVLPSLRAVAFVLNCMTNLASSLLRQEVPGSSLTVRPLTPPPQSRERDSGCSQAASFHQKAEKLWPMQ